MDSDDARLRRDDAVVLRLPRIRPRRRRRADGARLALAFDARSVGDGRARGYAAAGRRRRIRADDRAHGHRAVHRNAGVLEYRRPRKRLLRPLPAAAGGRVRRVRHAGHVPVLPLLRAGGNADVPAHRRVGEQLALPDVQPPERVRRDEADALPRGGQRPHLDSDSGDFRGSRAWDVRPDGAGAGRVLGGIPALLLPVPDDRIRRLGGALALPHVVAGRTRRRADGGEHGSRRRPDEAGRVRHNPRGHDAHAAGRGGVDARPARAWDGERPLRRLVGDGADGSEVRDRLFEREPHGLRGDGDCHAQPAWA